MNGKTMPIYTHKNVDMDCLISAYICEQYLNSKGVPCRVEFVTPQELKEKEKEGKGIVLDILYDGKLEVIDHHDGSNTCTARALQEKWNLSEEYNLLVEVAEACDTGEWFRVKRPLRYGSLATLVSALKVSGKSDEEIYQVMKPFFSALITLQKSLLQAKSEFDKLGGKILEANGYKIAVYKGGKTSINEYLFNEEGVSFVALQDGYNQLILRNARLNEPDLTEFKNFLGEKGKDYFAREFILSYGTRKHPATSPPPVELEELVSAFSKFLSTKEKSEGYAR